MSDQNTQEQTENVTQNQNKLSFGGTHENEEYEKVQNSFENEYYSEQKDNQNEEQNNQEGLENQQVLQNIQDDQKEVVEEKTENQQQVQDQELSNEQQEVQKEEQKDVQNEQQKTDQNQDNTIEEKISEDKLQNNQDQKIDNDNQFNQQEQQQSQQEEQNQQDDKQQEEIKEIQNIDEQKLQNQEQEDLKQDQKVDQEQEVKVEQEVKQNQEQQQSKEQLNQEQSPSKEQQNEEEKQEIQIEQTKPEKKQDKKQTKIQSKKKKSLAQQLTTKKLSGKAIETQNTITKKSSKKASKKNSTTTKQKKNEQTKELPKKVKQPKIESPKNEPQQQIQTQLQKEQPQIEENNQINQLINEDHTNLVEEILKTSEKQINNIPKQTEQIQENKYKIPMVKKYYQYQTQGLNQQEFQQVIEQKKECLMNVFEEMNYANRQEDEQSYQLYETLRRQLNSLFLEYQKDQYQEVDQNQDSLKEALRQIMLENEVLKEKLYGINQNQPKLNSSMNSEKTQSLEEEEKRDIIKHLQGDGQDVHDDKFLVFEQNKHLGEEIQQTYNFEIDETILEQYIYQIIESKSKFDLNCQENNLAQLTMEQYMFFDTRKKFKENELILSWIHAIIEAVQYYSNKNSTAQIFGMILKKQIDDQFFHIYDQIKNNLKQKAIEIYRIQSGSKSKPKSLPLSLVNQLVQEENRLRMSQKDQIIYDIKKELLKNKQNQKEERHDLNDLIEKIMKFINLNYRDKLSKLSDKFKDFDLNELGYVNQEQLVRMIREIKLDQLASRQEFLRNIDPHNHNIITFDLLVQSLKRLRVKVGQQSVDSIQWLNEN